MVKRSAAPQCARTNRFARSTFNTPWSSGQIFANFTCSLRTPGGPCRIDATMQKRPHPPAVVNESPLPPDRAFVVQFRAEGDAGTELFAGRVEHIASGAAECFASAEGLINFVTRVLASAGARPRAEPGRRNDAAP